MTEQQSNERKPAFFEAPDSFQFASAVNHYEGAPEDLSFPTDGSPIFIDHPMFSRDGPLCNLTFVFTMSLWPAVSTIKQCDAEGQPVDEESRQEVETRIAWLSGEIAIPQDEWEVILRFRERSLVRNGYRKTHPFGAPFKSREEKRAEKWDRKDANMSARKRRREAKADRKGREKLAVAKAMIPDLFHREGYVLNNETLEYEPVAQVDEAAELDD